MTGTDETQDTLLGVEAAQVVVLPSYQWAMTRYEAADSRVQGFISFAATITLSIPALVHGLDSGKSFHSCALYTAVGLFLLIFILGTWARVAGSFLLLSPAILYSKWLRYSDQEFKKRLLYHAGRAFDTNIRRLNNKARVLTLMTVLFAAEVIAFLVWLAH